MADSSVLAEVKGCVLVALQVPTGPPKMQRNLSHPANLVTWWPRKHARVPYHRPAAARTVDAAPAQPQAVGPEDA